MNQRFRQSFAALAAALLVGCAGTAQQRATDAPAPAAAQTQYADQNRDGSVSRDEAGVDKYLTAEFDNLDLDKDGALSAAEFERLSAKRAARRPSGAATSQADNEDAAGAESRGQTLNRSGR